VGFREVALGDRVRSALFCLALLAASGCGLEATETAPVGPSESGVADAVVVDEPIGRDTRPFVAATVPRERARALLPRIARDGAVTVSTSGSATSDNVRSAHLREVRRLECRDQYVDYPEQFDHWHSIDLDGDGSDEQLVFFTLEGFGGGNNYVRYLVVYRHVAPVWFAASTFLVGGKGSAGVTGASLRLQDGVLYTEAMLPDDDDGTCCPSLESELAFDVGIGGILTPKPIALREAGMAYRFFLLEFASSCG